jgi:hypothetical protein
MLQQVGTPGVGLGGRKDQSSDANAALGLVGQNVSQLIWLQHSAGGRWWKDQSITDACWVHSLGHASSTTAKAGLQLETCFREA